MSVPIEKEKPMQILVRIGQTVSMKSSDLDFGLMQPWRSDLTSSGPHFGGSPTTFILCNFLIGGHLNFFGHFSLLGIERTPLLGTPIKKLTPLC